VAVVLEVAALHADGLVARGAVQLQRLAMDFATRD
jgi:hypothetical protein